MTFVYVEALILMLNAIATLILLLHSHKEIPEPKKPPKPPKPPEPRSGTEESSRKQRFEKAVKSIVTHISMSSKKLQVGTQTVGQRIIGTQVEEVPWPAKKINIRQSRGPEDLHRRLPSERGLPKGIQMARLLAGEALVTNFQEERQIKEPIIKPVYEHRQSTVYLLLDRSGSMNEIWKPALWKGVAHGLLDQAMDDKALFLMREFDVTVTPTLRAHNSEEAAAIHTHIDSIVPGGGTVIKIAVEQAINDCIEHELVEPEIMILTDGEDNALDSAALRKIMDEAGIKLHAILIGTKNRALREAADLYQEVGQDYKIQEPVRR
jgi:Mg-chelatase subunit ChlD